LNCHFLGRLLALVMTRNGLRGRVVFALKSVFPFEEGFETLPFQDVLLTAFSGT